MANKVDTQHTLYATLEAKRDVYRAVKGGTDTIQAKGKTYLPNFPAEDPTEYNARLKASTIDGIVMSGVDTLTGAVFFDDIITDGVNTAIIPLLENIDNKGNHFNVFARQTFDAAFEGCSAIVIDRPKAPADTPVVSLEDQKTLDIRTYWRMYTAGTIRFWHHRVNPISKAEELDVVILYEPTDELVNRFEIKQVQKYRVYFLNGNVVNWELWRKIEDSNVTEFVLEDAGPLPEYSAIPISIVGCLDDDPRLLVESRLEVKAYQKESSFDVIEYLSVPIFYTIGYTPGEGEPPLKLGASTHVQIPTGQGNAVGFAQIDSAGHLSLKDSIEGIKEKIRSRVNELTTSAMAGPDKTATQSVIEDRDKQARLIVWAEQFKDALELALGFTAESMGMNKDEGGELVLQTKWEVEKQRADEAKAQQATADQANVDLLKAKAALGH